MKTTVDLSESLLASVRELAQRRGWTVKVVFEESLRAFLEREAASTPHPPPALQHTIVYGKGLVDPSLTFAQQLELSGSDRLPE